MSSESAVNLDQGDPLAEADFHMAYGLYDQAADLVRIALEREPGPARSAPEAARDLLRLGQQGRVPADREGAGGHARPGSRRRVGQDRHHGQADLPGRAAVRVDRRQRPRRGRPGRPQPRRRREPRRHRSVRRARGRAQQLDDRRPRKATTPRRPTNRRSCIPASDLDFTLDTPERGARSPTRPPRDEPTVEAEMMNFADAPTTESPALKTTEMRARRKCRRRAPTRPPKCRSTISGCISIISRRPARRPAITSRLSRRPIIRPMRRPWSRASTSARGA